MSKGKNLAKFIGYSIKKILKYLEIDKKFIYSSQIDKNNSLKGQFKIIDICQKLNAKEYINAIGGKSLYDREKFLSRGINFNFFIETNFTKHKNLNNFNANLLIIDIMMNYSKNEILDILNSYKLV